MFIFDSIGFGAAFALLIPGSYPPDIALAISDRWYAPPLIIIIFYAVGIMGQIITSSNRKVEQDSKRGVIFWGIIERLGFILIFIILKFYSDNTLSFELFMISYTIFVFSAGAILPSYFDLVSRVLYKYRSIFFSINLTTGSASGFLVSKYVDSQIKNKGLVDGYLDGLILVIVITTISLVPLILIREPKSEIRSKSKLKIKLIKEKLISWAEIVTNNRELRIVSITNFLSSVPESITPFFTIWLITYYEAPSYMIGFWVTSLLLSQSVGSFFVPIIGSKFGFKYTYILGLSMHFIASALFLIDGVVYQDIIFIFAGLGLGIFSTSQSNIAVELGEVGDAGNTNAMLFTFRIPIFITFPLIVAYFTTFENLSIVLISSIISALMGIIIILLKLDNSIFPQIRFWSKDS